MVDFERAVEDEIISELDVLSGEEVTSDAYKAAIDGVNKLMDKAIELEKIKVDAQTKADARISDAEFKQKQLEQEAEFKQKQLDQDAEFKQKQIDSERAMRMAQMKDDRIDKIVRNVLTGLSLGVTTFTMWGLASAAFTYEEKGTITSTIGRKILGMLVPKL